MPSGNGCSGGRVAGVAYARATSIASRVLPLPPSPTTLSSRHSASDNNATSCCSCAARPTNGAPTSGKLCAGGVIAARNRLNSAVVAGSGSTPSSSESTRRQAWYWAIAACRCPDRASMSIKLRWPSSSHGSWASRRRAGAIPALHADVRRLSWTCACSTCTYWPRSSSRCARSHDSKSGAPTRLRPIRNSSRNRRRNRFELRQ